MTFDPPRGMAMRRLALLGCIPWLVVAAVSGCTLSSGEEGGTPTPADTRESPTSTQQAPAETTDLSTWASPLPSGTATDAASDADQSPLPTPPQASPGPTASLPTAGAEAQDYAELLAKAAAEGQVNIIATLVLETGPFKPEGSFTDQVDVQKQRDAIVAAREALLASLEGYEVEVYGAWESLPSVALRVDLDALLQLVASPYVVVIQEDAADLPHSGAEGTGEE